MAELAPLTSAHAHARKAAEETHHVNWTQAAHEHSSAATEYSKAAQNTGDSEALRVLKLLEEQHLKLARIIRLQDLDKPEHSSQVTGPDGKHLAPSTHDLAQADKTAPAADAKSPPSTKPSTASLAVARLGSSIRDSSPSLARDIASRRGIPPAGRTPPSPAAQARARQLSPESHRRSRSSAAAGPKIPPSFVHSQAPKPAQKARQAEDDDAFAKFYSTVTTGTMSKLSSVLAYAGLPLTADDVKPDQAAQQKLKQRTVSASNEPDVKKIFSHAALKAIEDEHRQRGHQGHAFGPAESFYVVQTGGGTYSYADIARPQQQPLSGIDEDDEESFVDAREAQMPDSPRQSRFRSQQARGSFGKSRTHEELELENTTLKHTLEQLATRLTDFETHAQDASMAALTQSMVSVKTNAPPAQNPAPSEAALLERLKQMETRLEQQTEDNQRLQEVCAKQEKTLKKYQSKWEEIKASAKERQKAKAEKREKDSEGAAATSTG